MIVYNAVVRSLRFMLQANIGRERSVRGSPELLARYFPANPSLSLYRANPFVQRKYVGRPARYRTAALLEAYAKLLDVHRALRPAPTDLFVPDALPILERALAELFASAPPPRR